MPHPPTSKGEIFAYWEQGWEGRIEFAFQPDASTEPIMLENGDTLTIYGADGAMLWTGRIQFVGRRFWDRHAVAADIWSYVKQKDVPYGQWMAWFWHRPPLKATVIFVRDDPAQ